MFSPPWNTQETSDKLDDSRPSQSLSTSASQSPLSSATLRLNESSEGRAPPYAYVWLECRSRLHIEPGKGGKRSYSLGVRHVLEGACVKSGRLFQHDEMHRDCSARSTLLVCVHYHNLNTAAAIAANTAPFPPLMHSTLFTFLPSLRSRNTLHKLEPPSSDWSLLAGANGQGPNPLERSWRSEDGATT
jgi:hypothetical protein